jgi:hypothetical protein
VSEVHRLDTHKVEPTKPTVGDGSAAPKLRPCTVTIAEPERGEFGLATTVSTGESYVNAPVRVAAATDAIDKAAATAAPVPLAEKPSTDVCDTQTATVARCPMLTLIVASLLPKLKPTIESDAPDLAGPFRVPTEVMTGES